MYISFGRTLRRLGGVRFGVGFRMKGWTGAIMLFVYGTMYLCWYMILGMLWLTYGVGYVCFYLPIKGIVNYCKKKKRQKEAAESMEKYNPNPSQADN